MSSAARAATMRSHAPVLRTVQGSRAVSYSALPMQSSKLTSSQRSALQHTHLPSQLVSPFAALPLTRSFHAGNSLFQQQKEEKKTEEKGEEAKSESKEQEKEGEEGDKKEKKEEAPPPPPHGDKSPWQVFRDTLQTEFKASKEWNESTKALASSAHQFSENENIKRAREAYQAASGAATTRTGAALKSTGEVIGKGASWTWNTPVVKGVRKGVNATGAGLEKATRPVRETEAYKSVKDAIDDGSSSRYGGWIEKEERRKRREEWEAKAGGKPKLERMEEDPEAGTNVTLHKDAAWKESWRTFRDSNPMMQKLFTAREAYEESENPLISTARSITDRIGGFFAENETAQVVKKFREIDPNFQMEEFLRELREYMLPEVLDAYVKGDIETLKLWLSDAQYSVYAALSKQYTTAGLRSDGRILDVRGVDVSHARLLDPGDIPVFVVTCRAQEVHVYRNVKTGKLAAGMEDKVQLVTYAIGMTRIPEEVNNPETRGWRLIELQKAARDYI
ncbi:Mitochondrial import inner membrane translocase subunit tim44 [Penicillium malachiteum]|uniref:Mitochondrial import inner membrane translocase subunit tim44 n=1 Tax=Penicillium malachiteum TaxID=1324776 RepID=UPI002548771D|nr:Mitochondrial import inner membrane translocase subunit tim44 [Penicillium malachiteum]KAJ5714144.1 Mitochondrial import inner membrane translocase subunit tim44 [Penicillium malachiteum]